MSGKGVCRTAPATPGLLKKGFSPILSRHMLYIDIYIFFIWLFVNFNVVRIRLCGWGCLKGVVNFCSWNIKIRGPTRREKRREEHGRWQIEREGERFFETFSAKPPKIDLRSGLKLFYFARNPVLPNPGDFVIRSKYSIRNPIVQIHSFARIWPVKFFELINLAVDYFVFILETCCVLWLIGIHPLNWCVGVTSPELLTSRMPLPRLDGRVLHGGG